MSSGFLDLAYLIEISIVFNLAYREVKPLFNKHQIQDKIQQITKRKEVENTIEYCQNNPNRLAEEAVTNSYKEFTSTGDWLLKKIDESYWTKWININMVIVLCILLFATVYQHLTQIKYIVDNFDEAWWILFFILVVSIVFPIYLMRRSNENIKDIYEQLETASEKFLNTYSKYLAEKAEKQGWEGGSVI